ncbi:unnamed protein product [Pleuronectes platessa]|uniref:HECT domain-containing protein n=1 Tax=Pleuronectes platessa TaxID=8262 RepID=A0A9N7USH9_PLEPL|nr:unnamed protein product [Pleuronectes platessa]
MASDQRPLADLLRDVANQLENCSQTNPNDFREFILTAYPKLRQGGGFELLRIAGTTRSRNLNLIPCPNEGYNVKYLKDSQIGHAVLFIRPLQRSLDLEPECQPESMVGPPAKCISCGEEFSFSEIKDHSDECMRPPQSSGEGEVGTERASTSRSQDIFVRTLRREESEPARASSSTCTMPPQGDVPAPELIDLDPFGERSISDWKITTNAKEAARAYKEAILSQHASRKALSLIMDLGDSAEDRERAILSFYKMAHVEWACPLTCTLIGDPAIGDGVTRHFFSTIMQKLQNGFEINFVPGGTLLFEGEKDHLLPSTSLILLESDLFVVAGRMIGHSFLHDGPCLSGLSPAILHVLFGGSPEEATIDIKDCADLDIRETIKVLDGREELSSEQKISINELALSWDLPPVTSENRRWLLDKMLLHAVLRRTSKQLKQLRKGLKETLVWPLLNDRKDTIPLVFPRASELEYTPRMVLDKIKWPTQDEEEDSDVSLEDTCRITGFLRTFIENASPNFLGKLLEFWVGWSVLPRHLDVEVVESNFPKSSTCFHLLKLPHHYKEYFNFERDIVAAICSTDTGFGMV